MNRSPSFPPVRKLMCLTAFAFSLSLLRAEVVVSADFTRWNEKEWIKPSSTTLVLQEHPALKGKGMLVTNKFTNAGVIRGFKEVNLNLGERIKLEFDLLLPDDLPPDRTSDNPQIRFGLVHLGADRSTNAASKLNDKGYGVNVGRAPDRTFALGQDMGTEGGSFYGKDYAAENLSGANGAKGGDKSGVAFLGLTAGKPEHVSLEITRTDSGLLLEAQIGQSFRNSQDRADLQTKFAAFTIISGQKPQDFLIANLKVEHIKTPAKAPQKAPETETIQPKKAEARKATNFPPKL